MTTTALDSAHSALGRRFSTTTAVGGAAHHLLDGAHALAAETVQGFLAAQGQELIFYTPGAPDDYLLASSLPYTLSLDARGQLQGGNRLMAVASLLIPILVSVIIGIAVLVKVVYVAVR